MARQRFDVDEVLDAIFDSDFGLSEGESSADEDGEDFYAYLGDPVVGRASISALTDRLTIDAMDVDTAVDDNADDDGHTSEGDEPTAEEEIELDLSEPGGEDMDLGNGYDTDESFAATSRADKTASIPGSSSDSPSVNPDMHEPSPTTSSDEASPDDSSVTSTRGSLRGGVRTRRGRGSTAGRGRPSYRGRAGRGRGRGRAGRGRGRGRAGCGSASRQNVDSGEESDEDRWQKKEATSFVYPYRSAAGPTAPVSTLQNETALDLFCRFFTDEVWQLIVDETNRYASANTASTPHARPWSDVTIPEMKAFIGMLILMGIVELPRLEMYWQTKHPLIATTGISSVMSLVRFEQLYRFLHLANSDEQVPSGDPGHDKLFKVRKLLDLVLPKFESEYTLHAPVTIDEAMIPFKGRLSFKQYIKNKPVKWGIKAFVLSDATNGYVYKMQVYTGKGMETTEPEVGLCSRVVLDLMSGLEHLGLDLYTDNYYTSPELYLELYNRGVNACGTVRTNRRGYPKELVHKSKTGKERGFYDYRSKGPLLAVVWFDRRYINFLSTLHVAEASAGPTTVLRHQQDGSRVAVECPPLLPDYQQYMRGVDRGDQLIGLYNVGRRSKKWWKRLFSHIIECAILNAYILDSYAHPVQHALRGRSKRDFLKFRIELATQLIGNFRSRKRAGRRTSDESANLERLNLSLGHFPVQAEKKLECIVCRTQRQKQKLSRSELRHESIIKCSHCNVHLCVHKDRPCFTKYHTLVRYWV